MADTKIMTAKEAVQKFLKPGICLCIGGFSYTRKPMTLIREIIRQGIGDLFVTMNGGASCAEFLAANSLIKWLDTTYIGLEGLQPVAFSIRRQIEDGQIQLLEDYSNYGFALRTLAGKYGWPFAPLQAELGADLLEYDVFGKAGLRGKNADGTWIHPSIPPKKFAVIEDPFDGWGYRPHAFEGGDTTANQSSNLDVARHSDKYTGKEGMKVVLVPPILPEVCIMRAQRVGIGGTVRLEGIWGPDIEQACAAKVLIIECEKIVSEEELRTVPDANHVGAHFVDAIVEQPFGGYPSAVPNYYDYDWDFWVNYSRINRRSEEEVKEYWHKMVVETKDDWEYLTTRVGTDYTCASGKKGMDRLFELRADVRYGYKPDLARPL